MTNNWIKNVSDNLFPLSQEQADIKKCLSEWFYYDNTHDLETPCEDCELCGQQGIRFQFEIENNKTGKALLIGSECIKRFSIGVMDADGKILSNIAANKKVDKDRRTLISDAKTKRMIRSLVGLSQKDTKFNDIDKSIEYFKERGAFSPNHLAFLLWRLEENEVEFNKSDFKMTIRRRREKSQLLQMEDWKVRKILPSMSASQKKFYHDNKE